MEEEISRIFIMADIHGDWRPIRDFHLRNNCNKKYNNSNKTMILLGDSGLNYFFNNRDEKFKQKLGKFPLTYFVIRGNHEERPSICAEKNPDKWHREFFWSWFVWVENDYPYIKYAEDFVSFYVIPYKNEKSEGTVKTLVIPGAYSVDKYKRLQNGWSWFPQEQLNDSEKQAGRDLLDVLDWKCDLVLSHTCPFTYEPTELFLSVVDQSTVEKDMERYLEEIERNLDYKLWCFGHYHSTKIYPPVDGKQMLMLFHESIDLSEWIKGRFGKWY